MIPPVMKPEFAAQPDELKTSSISPSPFLPTLFVKGPPLPTEEEKKMHKNKSARKGSAGVSFLSCGQSDGRVYR